jgi:hypothetical protein
MLTGTGFSYFHRLYNQRRCLQSAALLEREVSDLRSETEKKKQKRARSGKHLYALLSLEVQRIASSFDKLLKPDL